MVGARTATALAGVAVSLALSILLWMVFDTLLLFLFVPFVPFLFRGFGTSDGREREPAVRACPQCGFSTRNDEYDYCPRDGHRLEQSESWR